MFDFNSMQAIFNITVASRVLQEIRSGALHEQEETFLPKAEHESCGSQCPPSPTGMFSVSYGALNSFCLGWKPLSKERTRLKNSNTAFSASWLTLFRTFGVSSMLCPVQINFFLLRTTVAFFTLFAFYFWVPFTTPTIPPSHPLSLPRAGFGHKEQVNSSAKGDKKPSRTLPSPAPRPGQAWGAINIFME